MAFGRLERPQGSEPMSEINMTPLIDVMLVLLVIFMLTAPLMTSRLKLELPKADAAPEATEAPAIMSVALTADGRLHLEERDITLDALAKQAVAQAQGKPDTEVQLRADRVVAYGRVAELIGVLQKAGLHRIAFVTEGGEGEPAQPATQAPNP